MPVTNSYSLTFYQDIALTQGPSDGPVDLVGDLLGTTGFAGAGNHSVAGGHTDLNLFSGSSTPFGGKTNIGFTNPAIDRLNNGNFIIAGQDADSIVYTIVDGTGATVTVETDLNDTGSTNADVSEASTLNGYWIASQDLISGTNSDIDIRRYSSTGALQANFTVDATTAIDSAPSIDELRFGNLAVAWTRTIGAETELWTAVYNDAGGIVAAAAVADTTGTVNRDVSVAAMNDGGFAVVYQDNGWGSGNDISLRTFSASGASTGVYNISNPALAADVLSDQKPDIDVLIDGKLAISWTGVDIITDNRVTKVALVDPATGTVLATRAIANAGSDPVDPAIATFGGAGIAVSHTDGGTNKGEMMLAFFNAVGDAADNMIFGEQYLYNNLRGLGGNDSISGGFTEDLLNGEAGDDGMSGGNGNDQLNGGDNNDILAGGDGNDTLDGGAGIDTADYGDSIFAVVVSLAIAGPQNTNWGNDTLVGIENLRGTHGSDTLTGNSGANELIGEGGGDQMTGGLGNDTYHVDAAGDVVTELVGQGFDTVNTSLASYTLGANVERVNYTGAGNFVGTGNALANRFQGGAGDDRFVDVLGGNDIFSGNAGTDTIDFRSSATGAVIDMATLTHGGAAAGDSYSGIEKFLGSNTAGDTMSGGGTGRWVFAGGGGNDSLTGGIKNDQLLGQGGNDILKGNGDRDSLDGGTGNDTMTGGSQGDVFVFIDAAFGQDTISDYVDGLDSFKIFSAVADNVNDFTIAGNGTTSVTLTLIASPTHTIAVNGAAPINIAADDFVFF